MMNKQYIVEIPEFITHIAKTRNKTAPNKFIKINNQLIYNSNLSRFPRNIVMDNLHTYLIKYITSFITTKLINPPYQVLLDVYVPINYGDVSRRIKKGIPYICWNEPKEDYEPTWDIDNLGDIWLKVFKDALQLSGVLENDHVGFIKANGPATFHQIQDLKDRKLVFKIIEI